MDVYVRDLQADDGEPHAFTGDGRFDPQGYFAGKPHQRFIGLGVQVGKLVHFLFGDAKRMSPAVRVDIEKGQVGLILGYLVAG